MGMKALIVAGSPSLPRHDLAALPTGPPEASRAAAEAILPGLVGARIADGNLSEDCYPRDAVFAGTFGETWIVASSHDSLLTWEPAPAAQLNHFKVFMHSVVSMAGFNYWGSDGTRREFAGSMEEGPFADLGLRLAFENAVWSGSQSDQAMRELWGDAMPFDPMSLGEEALKEFFGFVGEGVPNPTDLDGFEILMHGFALNQE